MIKRFSEPELQPVYALEQSLDTILGFDYLHTEIQALSAQYPQDEHHLAMQQFAETLLADSRQVEVGQAGEFAAQTRTQRVTTKLAQLSGVADTKERIRQNQREVKYLEKTPADLFKNELSEADSAERGVIQAIIQRKIDKTQGQHATNESRLAELQEGVEKIRAILGRRIPVAPASPLQDIAIKEAAAASTTRESLPSGYDRVLNILRTTQNETMYECKLVETLFGDIYRADRPEAYRRFDAMYESFGILTAAQCRELGRGFIQKGSLYKANQGGRATGTSVNVLYRYLRPDNEILKSKGLVQQRVSIGRESHVIVWDKAAFQETRS